MPEVFEIIGGIRLGGTVTAGGSKNAAFPLLAASVLCSTPLRLGNIPNIEDIRCFLKILNALGMAADIEHDHSVHLDASLLRNTHVSKDLGSRIRGSYYLLGALLAKFGHATICFPGGCNIGSRPMDLHISTLSQLGYDIKIDEERGLIEGTKREVSRPNYEITLPFPSRGATINLLLATSLMSGTRVSIHNANVSPETLCLQLFLASRGVPIQGLGTENIVITGVNELDGGDYLVIPDKTEIGTLLCAGLITRGTVTVQGILENDIRPLLDKLSEIGYQPTVSDNNVTVSHTDNLRSVSVISGLVPPTIDADWEPILAALLCTIPGVSTIQDKINPERHLRYLPELISFGAQVEKLDDQTAIVSGGAPLMAARVSCKEIRGGAALTLAALAATGRSEIINVEQIDRGYEQLESKLKMLGARIRRLEAE